MRGGYDLRETEELSIMGKGKCLLIGKREWMDKEEEEINTKKRV